MHTPTDPLRTIVEQYGVFLRSEALALGVDDNALRRLVRAGVLTKVRHGSYTFSDLWEAMGPETQHLVVGRAAMRRSSGVALSHTTGAINFDMDVWQMDLGRVHLTRTDGNPGGTYGDMVHHEGFVSAEEIQAVAGLPSLPAARVALETALLGGAERGLVTVSSGLRLGLFTTDQLGQQHATMSHWPEARPLHVVVPLASGAHESVGEVRTAYLFWSQGLPRPIAQLEVHDEHGRFLGRCDFGWPQFRLVVEFDGAAKYQRYLRPGETPGDAVFREKRREDALRAAGWTVLRITWADLQRPRETAQRIRAAMRLAA